MISIAHIINPVKVDDSSDLFLAQPITFETMRTAKKHAAADVDITFYAACYPEDTDIVPVDFNTLPPLTRSVMDIREFKVKRKLPLLKDILDSVYAASFAQYIIYTNVDIALLPQFYNAVNRFISQGYDAFVINRRTITTKYKSIAEIPFMVAEIGQSHNGYDCFVFKRQLYPQFQLGNICIGTAWVGRALLANIVTYADKFKEFRHEHLTFHIGDPCTWRNEQFNDYIQENQRQYHAIFAQLESQHHPFDPIVRSYLLDTADQRTIPDFQQYTINKGKLSKE